MIAMLEQWHSPIVGPHPPGKAYLRVPGSLVTPVHATRPRRGDGGDGGDGGGGGGVDGGDGGITGTLFTAGSDRSYECGGARRVPRGPALYQGERERELGIPGG